MSHSGRPTPDLGHLQASDYDSVYEPSEDTFLLLDALSLPEEEEFLAELRPLLCVEVGAGSGCVLTFLAQILSSKGLSCHALAVDLNPVAASVARTTALHNGVSADALHADLLTALSPSRILDVVLFNPPYVPTDPSEVSEAYQLALRGMASLDSSSAPLLLPLAWAGGIAGREVLDRFLQLLFRGEELERLPRCVYLLLLEENKPQEVVLMFSSRGYSCKLLKSRRARNELLHVYRFSR